MAVSTNAEDIILAGIFQRAQLQYKTAVYTESHCRLNPIFILEVWEGGGS